MPHKWKKTGNNKAFFTWQCEMCGHVHVKSHPPDPYQRVRTTLDRLGSIVDTYTDDDGNHSFHDRNLDRYPYTDKLMFCEEIIARKVMNS